MERGQVTNNNSIPGQAKAGVGPPPPPTNIDQK